MRSIYWVIQSEVRIAKECLISRGMSLKHIKGSPSQWSSFTHLDFSSLVLTGQQGKSELTTCLFICILLYLCAFAGSHPGFPVLSGLGPVLRDWFWDPPGWFLSGRTSAGQYAKCTSVQCKNVEISGRGCHGILVSRDFPSQFEMDFGISMF